MTAAIHMGISATGSVVGTIVACVTYSTLRGTANGSAFVVGQGSRFLGFLLGHGVGYVSGSRIGDIVRVATETTGTEVIAPAIRTGGEISATATAAVAGAGAALVTTGVIYGGMYVGKRVYENLPAMPQRNFLQHPEPLRHELKDGEDGFDMVVVPGDHISQIHTPENAVAAAAANPVIMPPAAARDPDLPFSLTTL